MNRTTEANFSILPFLEDGRHKRVVLGQQRVASVGSMHEILSQDTSCEFLLNSSNLQPH